MEMLRRLYRGTPVTPTPLSAEFLARLEEAHQSTAELDGAVSKYSYLVVGGNGFLGSYVCRELLLRKAAHVRVLSRSPPLPFRRLEGVEYMKGSVAELADVEKAMDGIDVVFHLAAYTGSPDFGYRKKEERERSVKINEGGARNVVRAAEESGNVRLIIYTSSVDATFTTTGFSKKREDELEYVEESEEAPLSHYQATKTAAEKIILGANSAKMRTVALRPGGIFGPQETYILGQTLQTGWVLGRHFIQFGTLNPELGEKQLADFSFAPNIAFAHSLLVRQLEQDPDSFAGKAYYIHDDHPMCVGNAEMFEQVLNAVGIEVKPMFTVPGRVIVAMGTFMELLHEKLSEFGVDIPVPVTRHAALKVSVHHTHSIEAAASDFGYYPIIPSEEAWRWTAEEYKARVEQQG